MKTQIIGKTSFYNVSSEHSQLDGSSFDAGIDDDCFVIGRLEILIPFANLDSFEILQNVDLKYFYTKCREALKKIYDESFKQDNNKYYKDLKNYLK